MRRRNLGLIDAGAGIDRCRSGGIDQCRCGGLIDAGAED
jgi:hypothetical protein